MAPKLEAVSELNTRTAAAVVAGLFWNPKTDKRLAASPDTARQYSGISSLESCSKNVHVMQPGSRESLQSVAILITENIYKKILQSYKNEKRKY